MVLNYVLVGCPCHHFFLFFLLSLNYFLFRLRTGICWGNLRENITLLPAASLFFFLFATVSDHISRKPRCRFSAILSCSWRRNVAFSIVASETANYNVPCNWDPVFDSSSTFTQRITQRTYFKSRLMMFCRNSPEKFQVCLLATALWTLTTFYQKFYLSYNLPKGK